MVDKDNYKLNMELAEAVDGRLNLLILHARGWGGQRCGQGNNEVELVLPN